MPAAGHLLVMLLVLFRRSMEALHSTATGWQSTTKCWSFPRSTPSFFGLGGNAGTATTRRWKHAHMARMKSSPGGYRSSTVHPS
jgi:hypothetical protein